MSHYRIYRRQAVRGTMEEVFPFFRDPFNLERLTPPWLRFRILDATDSPIRAGTVIRYRLSLCGLPFAWIARIAEFEEGVGFADEQVAGPYRTWYHRHRFVQEGDRVVIEDVVDYDLGWGPIGAVVHRGVVRRQLEGIFDYRARAVASRFP